MVVRLDIVVTAFIPFLSPVRAQLQSVPGFQALLDHPLFRVPSPFMQLSTFFSLTAAPSPSRPASREHFSLEEPWAQSVQYWSLSFPILIEIGQWTSPLTHIARRSAREAIAASSIETPAGVSVKQANSLARLIVNWLLTRCFYDPPYHEYLSIDSP